MNDAGERAYEDLVLDRVSWLNRWFDIEAYSCAVREARSDGADDAPSSPLKQGMANRPCAGGCGTLSIPSSLAYAREDLTQSFHRLSVCVYGNSLLENGDANLLLSSAEGGSDKSVAQMPSLCTFSDLTSSIDSNYVQPEESSEHARASDRSELQYEELWTEQTALAASRYCCVSSLGLDSCSKAPRGGLVLRRGLSQEPQGPPPVPPKSDAVRVECRMLNAPPVPPRSGRPSSSPPLPPRSVPPSPNLSFYSSGLLHLVDDAFDKIGSSSEWTKPPHNRSCKRIRPSSVGHPSPRHNADGVSNDTRRGSGPDTNSMSFYEQQPIFPGFAQTSLATVDFHSQSHVLAFPPPVTKVETLKNMSDKTPVSNGHTDVPNMSPVCKSSSPHDEFHLSKACACDHSRSPKHILAAEGSKPHSGCNCDCCIISTPNSPCTLPGVTNWPTETTECVPPLLPFCGTPGDRSSGDGMAWQPPDELSGLSVEGVCQCLRFIGLSEEALGRFSHECVDGALLTQLTEEMLLLDFQLSKLQARKVLQFAGGWRPKL
uniref:SAM domain-containing protein n=2 Tax=Eptatretus burgeri TaxID=7764 RepID=A0A8C4QP57_EPTBU